MQTPEPSLPDRDPPAPGPGLLPGDAPRLSGGPSAWGERLGWISGLVLALSAFTDWYAGAQSDGLVLSVIGWHTGALGKIVFFVGLAALALVALREAGIELPATVPESLILIGLGSLATIFVLIRLISIPDTFFGTAGRGIGIWISLFAALAMIASGLLRAAEEL
ncbi:MAG: hypothetical protein ABR569_03495 [Gaiellaceae bacterium]